MINIAVYEKESYLRCCVVVRRSYGHCIDANMGFPAPAPASAATSDATIVFADH